MLCTSLQAWCLCVCYCWVNQEGKWSIKENCIKLKLGRETGGKLSRIRLGKGGTAGRKVIQREGISDRHGSGLALVHGIIMCVIFLVMIYIAALSSVLPKGLFGKVFFFFFHLHGSCLFLPRSDVILCSHDVYATSLSFETTKTSTYKWCLQNKVISSPSGYSHINKTEYLCPLFFPLTAWELKESLTVDGGIGDWQTTLLISGYQQKTSMKMDKNF